VTTVLKVAQQLQQPGRRGLRPAVQAGPGQLRSAVWPIIAGVMAAAAVTLILWRSPRLEGPRPESSHATGRGDAAVSAAPERAAERAGPRPSAAEAAPQRIEAKPAAAPPIADIPPRARQQDRSRPQPRLPHAGEEQAATNPRRISAEQPVRVRSIRYAEDPARRAVTLSAGSDTVTLREGESAGGVEVQLILPTVVYVRRGATVFAVQAETAAAR